MVLPFSAVIALLMEKYCECLTKREILTKLFEQVRELIDGCGESRYTIAKATGISQGQLSSFMAGKKGLGRESLERLLDQPGYEIYVEKKGKDR